MKRIAFISRRQLTTSSTLYASENFAARLSNNENSNNSNNNKNNNNRNKNSRQNISKTDVPLLRNSPLSQKQSIQDRLGGGGSGGAGGYNIRDSFSIGQQKPSNTFSSTSNENIDTDLPTTEEQNIFNNNTGKDKSKRKQKDKDKKKSKFVTDQDLQNKRGGGSQKEKQKQKSSSKQQNATKNNNKSPPKKRAPLYKVKIELPSVISVDNLSRLLSVKTQTLERKMKQVGMDDIRPDRMLNSEDASLIALEFDREPVVDNEAALDLYPTPPENLENCPLRPPIVAIMGHVDHGKTTLLDKLRNTTVAAFEAGGITQHIGAFTVSLPSLPSVVFLDTPGHAAFSAMRARGAQVTDIIVLVVAADDGVKPQTIEVINLLKDSGMMDKVVVALTKCDKPDVNTDEAKAGLAEAGLYIEDYGGNVPCVHVSGATGQGLESLIETISTLSEVMDLRADPNAKVEGVIIESRQELGRGNIATMIVRQGTLTRGTNLVAGFCQCTSRALIPTVRTEKPLPPSPSSSKSSKSQSQSQSQSSSLPRPDNVEQVTPGFPIQIPGWDNIPHPGEIVLQAQDFNEASLVIKNRERNLYRKQELEDMEIINERKREEEEANYERRTLEKQKWEKLRSMTYNQKQKFKRSTNNKNDSQSDQQDNSPKTLNLIIKSDVYGSSEAIREVLASIGNDRAKTNIVLNDVGKVYRSDIDMARTTKSIIIAYNTMVERGAQDEANRYKITVKSEKVIYRLAEFTKEKVIELLPSQYASRIVAEADVLQIFNISVKNKPVPVAGCRVQNGTLARKNKVRVVRNGNMIFEGDVESLKHHKDEVDEIAKGTECGLMLEGFSDIRPGDKIHSIDYYELPKHL